MTSPDHRLEEILPPFRLHRSFVLTTHINPDGDGLGSELALAFWLEDQGKEALIINTSPTPQVYQFLDPRGVIRVYDQARDAGALLAAEVIVVLDTNHPGRLDTMQEAVLKSPATKLCIDHHLDPAPFADLYCVDEDATSTGEIVYRLLEKLSESSISPRIAEALYCAIMTDTGSFRYPRTDPETFRIAARLIERGADPVDAYTQIYEQWSPGRMKLLGEMLAGLTLGAGGRLASVTVTREMLERTATSEEDTDTFTSYPMSIRGVVAGILFLETQRGVKISFRSRGDIPINELAQEFGGNGHKNAAGARLNDTDLPRLRQRVLAAAERYLTMPSEETP
jgi:phosphoesterase RecJ-like protein